MIQGHGASPGGESRLGSAGASPWADEKPGASRKCVHRCFVAAGIGVRADPDPSPLPMGEGASFSSGRNKIRGKPVFHKPQTFISRTRREASNALGSKAQ